MSPPGILLHAGTQARRHAGRHASHNACNHATTCRHFHRARAAAARNTPRQDVLRRTWCHQHLAPDQRHDAVADPGDVPHSQGRFPSEFWPDRADHAHVPAHRLAAAAADRAVHRQAAAAVFPAPGHVFDPVRADAAGFCLELRHRAGSGRAGGHGIGHLPSRILAHCAPGFRRPARAGAIGVPGRWQYRQRSGPADRRGGGGALRPAQCCLVRPGGPAGHCAVAAGEPLVRGTAACAGHRGSIRRCPGQGQGCCRTSPAPGGGGR